MKISPSVLACDLSILEREVAAMQEAGADMIHLDVMDGHFVPNLTFGPPVIARLRAKTSAVFDAHLMIDEPLRWIDEYAEAGSDIITFHFEAGSDIAETIARIKLHGVKAGLSIKPATPAQMVLPYLDDLDMVLVMTVEPGFGGQKFMRDQMEKLRLLRGCIAERGLPVDLQVDGGIDIDTAPVAAQNGANVLVAGTALYGKPDYGTAVAQMRAAALAAVN